MTALTVRQQIFSKSTAINILKILGLAGVIFASYLGAGPALLVLIKQVLPAITPYEVKEIYDFIVNPDGVWNRVNMPPADLKKLGWCLIILPLWWVYNRFVYKLPLYKNPIPWKLAGAWVAITTFVSLSSLLNPDGVMEHWDLLLYDALDSAQAGPWEEVVFRGLLVGMVVLFTTNKQIIFRWIMLVTLIFAVAHFANAREEALILSTITVFYAFFSGIILSLFFVITGRLWVGVVLHMLWNALSTSFMIRDVHVMDMTVQDLSVFEFGGMAVFWIVQLLLLRALYRHYMCDSVKTA